MKYIKKDDLKNELSNRYEYEDGKIEFGIYKVLFGYRIRAGFVGSSSCEIDWCCGDNNFHVSFLYNLVKEYLESFEGSNPFLELPICSKIKPYYKDEDFMNIIKNRT